MSTISVIMTSLTATLAVEKTHLRLFFEKYETGSKECLFVY